MHYHLHLMPRTAAGPEIPVCTWELNQGDMDAIRRTAEKIAAAID
jgi:diadenosine tetraphosphate (Ap4A) HIT family hydrolase